MTIYDRFIKKVKKTSNCWIWMGAKSRGYGKLAYGELPKLKGKRRQVFIRAHRCSYEIAHGPIPEGFIVCHKCDRPSCVNPQHLFLGTLADNFTDMRNKGRGRGGSMPGESNPSAKLTKKRVNQIRTIYAKGKTSQKALAQLCGVSQSLVSMIVLRQIWHD